MEGFKYSSRFLIARTDDQLQSMLEPFTAKLQFIEDAGWAHFSCSEISDLTVYAAVVDSKKKGHQVSTELFKIIATTKEPAIIYISAACCSLVRNCGSWNGYSLLRILQANDDVADIMERELLSTFNAIQAFLDQQQRYVREHMEWKERPKKRASKTPKKSKNGNGTDNKELAERLLKMAANLLDEK